MKLYPAVSTRARLACLAATAALLLSASAAAAARQYAPAPSARRSPDVERIRDQQRREMGLRRGEEAAHPPDERAVKAAVKQLGEDFRRIQVIRNDVARALVAGGALDYARVSEQAVEVRKRALRMQTYLGLRDTKEEEKQQHDAAASAPGEGELKQALVRLCKRIDSFVASPRFTSPGVVDVDGDAKAGRDLREIISLSAAVREGASRLGRDGSTAKHEGP